jgi:hypothetical protein
MHTVVPLGMSMMPTAGPQGTPLQATPLQGTPLQGTPLPRVAVSLRRPAQHIMADMSTRVYQQDMCTHPCLVVRTLTRLNQVHMALSRPSPPGAGEGGATILREGHSSMEVEGGR